MQNQSRPRPPVLRALGAADPPSRVTVAGRGYLRLEIYKHDSWAATAKYVGASGLIVCKFNRTQPAYGIGMAWLGRWLAARERRTLERLADVRNVPNSLGEVVVNGEPLPNAVARVYIAGHPLRRHEHIHPGFFSTMQRLLDQMHERGIAYVDLHKRENVIVGDDGQPYLIDFQIGFDATRFPLRWLPGISLLFHILSQADLYHLRKHMAHHLPEWKDEIRRPWWIHAHRAIAVPLRRIRRQLLVVSKVRTGVGKVESEQFAEDAVRHTLRRAA